MCKACDSLYSFEDCLEKVGTATVVRRCVHKHFNRTCNELLMKEIVCSSGHKRFYPHKVFCFSNLICSLQTLVLRDGFVHQCESTRKAFASVGVLSDVYDGLIWKEFLTVNHTPLLSACNNYGLLLNVDWIQPYKHIVYSVGLVYLVILNLPVPFVSSVKM